MTPRGLKPVVLGRLSPSWKPPSVPIDPPPLPGRLGTRLAIQDPNHRLHVSGTGSFIPAVFDFEKVQALQLVPENYNSVSDWKS